MQQVSQPQRKADGFVYRGTDRIHITDGERVHVGEEVADYLDRIMRNDAVAGEARTWDQVYGPDAQPLCPGCYMPAMFNALVYLAKRNGQSLRELGRTMSAVFNKLADGGEDAIEDIRVYLDDEDDAPAPELPMTERDLVFGLTSFGLDMGLLR